MSADQVATFVAVLALVALAGSFVTIVLLIARLGGVRSAGDVLDGVSPMALWLAALVATVCTVGSLYFSEVAGYIPCELCWYQRICVYPLSAILLIAAIRRDAAVWRYAALSAVVGAAIAAYHSQLQAFPEQRSFCSLTVPCTTRYVWEFGFVSLPFMSLCGFVFILLMLRVATLSPTADSSPTTEPTTSASPVDAPQQKVEPS